MSRQWQQTRNQSRAIIPSNEELSVQMSPFGDERWDLDEEENRRRKETHRQYVYSIHSKKQQQQQEVPKVDPKEESKPIVNESPRKVKEELEEIPKPEVENETEKDYFKFELPKPKSISELSFDTPSPPNLYPVLRFPERLDLRNKMYKVTESTAFTPPVPGVAPAEEVYDLPPKTQFSVYKDIKFDNKVFHYGVHVPFWQFSRNDGSS